MFWHLASPHMKNVDGPRLPGGLSESVLTSLKEFVAESLAWVRRLFP